LRFFFQFLARSIFLLRGCVFTADEYENLLDHAYSEVPEKISSGERFECPIAQVFVEGNKSFVRNYDFVCERLRRKPDELAKYLFKELAVPGVVEGGRLVLQGKFSAKQINDRIQSYCENQVICKECGKPDTRLESAGGRNLRTMICEACGARSPVRA